MIFFAPSQGRSWQVSVFLNIFPEWISSRISLNHHFIVWIYIEHVLYNGDAVLETAKPNVWPEVKGLLDS